MEQIVIDGKEFDVSNSGEVAVTVRGTDLSDYTRIKESYTTTVKGPKSQNNLSLLNFPNVIGMPEPGAYEKKRASILSDGVPLIQSGSIQLVTSGNEINLTVIGRGVDLPNILKTRTLKDIDFGSANNQTYGSLTLLTLPQMETWLSVDYTATSPKEGSHNVYGKVSRDTQVPPFIQKKVLLEYIIEQAGYELNDSLLENYGHYDRSFVSLQVPEGKVAHDFDGDLYISEWMHDVNQYDFFSWVLHQYGVIPFVIGNVVTLAPIAHIQKLKGQGPDWSNKIDLSNDPVIGYDTGYGYVNRWEYLGHDTDFRSKFFGYFSSNNLGGVTTLLNDSLRYGEITSNNKNLEAKKTIAQIGFYVGQEATVENAQGSPRNLIYLPCFDGTTGMFTGTYPMHDVIIPELPTTYKETGGAAESWAFSKLGGTTADHNGSFTPAFFASQDSHSTVTNTTYDYGLDHLVHLIPTFFAEKHTEFIRSPKTIVADFNLNATDIKFFSDGNQQTGSYIDRYLSKATPIYCSWLDGYYVVKEISRYISGQTVKVELIKI